jgi:hypothetical protein
MKITKEITYPAPDTYLSHSFSKGRTASNTYIGPDKIWILVHKEGENKGFWNTETAKTNDLTDGDFECQHADHVDELLASGDACDMTEAIEALPVPLDMERLCIDCTGEDAYLCALFLGPNVIGDETGDYLALPQKDYYLENPDGSFSDKPFYSRTRTESLAPDHIWDAATSHYDSDTETWTLAGIVSWGDWDTHRGVRNKILEETDRRDLMPEGEEKAAWQDYRQALRDVPQKFKDVPTHMVPFPADPEHSAHLAEDEEADGVVYHRGDGGFIDKSAPTGAKKEWTLVPPSE